MVDPVQAVGARRQRVVPLTTLPATLETRVETRVETVETRLRAAGRPETKIVAQEKRLADLSRAYFASGSGRIWNFTVFCLVPCPPSRCQAA